MRIFFFSIALLTALVPPTAHAQIAYTVSPLVMDLEAKARDIITKTIILTNTGTVPVTVYPTVNNISLTEGGTIEEFVPQVMSDRTRSLASWIEVSRRGIDLIPGEPYTLPVTFRMSPDPVPGTYHALIGFGYGRNQDEAKKQVEGGRAPGSIITLTVPDDRNEFLKLSRFIIDRFVTSAENQAAAYTFTNPGDETVVPEGEIILYDATGREVGSVAVNEEKVSIPPGGEHTFRASVPVEGLFGKYKAFLSIEYGSVNRASLQDTSFFYALPLERLILIFVVLALFVALISWYFHRRYLDEDADDSDRIVLHVRESASEAKEHDINLKKQ